jgi:hypothetical protein
VCAFLFITCVPHSPSVQFYLVVITLHASSVLRILFLSTESVFLKLPHVGALHWVGDHVSNQHKVVRKVTILPIFIYFCQSDRLLGSCDRGFECHLGHILMLFFCLWHGMSLVQRAAAPTKVFYQMSVPVQTQEAVGRAGQ